MQNGSGNFTPFANLCEKETEGEMIGHAVFLGVVMAFTLFGNFMVIGTVATYEKLRTVTNYFVISLAVSDVLVGFTTLPLKVSFALINCCGSRFNTQQKRLQVLLCIKINYCIRIYYACK